jgi:beta-glucosidase
VSAPLHFNHAAGADLSLPKSSFRFAYSRAEGDLQAAATAAASAKVAVVFLQDTGAPPEFNGETVLTEEPDGGQSGVPAVAGDQGTTFAVNESYPLQYQDLVEAVAAANPNTVVVSNTTDPMLMPWISQVQSVLQMWYSSEEGGTATARTLLGLNNPGGHVPETWAAGINDNIWSYNETTLLPGDTLDSLGTHPERLDQANPGNANPTTETEGIFTDYRFFDQEKIDPLFPFGWGLSYTTFSYSTPTAVPDGTGGVNVTTTVTNTGSVSGSDVAQVYSGPPPNAAALEAQGVQFAPRQLAGFKRVTLAAGARPA